FYNASAGRTRLATETGAGQWGSALAFACQAFGLECKVYMVNISYQQKPYRRVMMETWGAQVVASPSPDTNAGRSIRERDPESLGSLGIAISEAVEDAATREDTSYSLGSVLNHARPRLRAARHPRRRPALPRRGADRLAAAAGRADPGRGLHPERLLRRRPAVRPQRGHHPGAGELTRNQGRDRRRQARRRVGRL